VQKGATKILAAPFYRNCFIRLVGYKTGKFFEYRQTASEFSIVGCLLKRRSTALTDYPAKHRKSWP
jgi:hypothetical protein